MSSEENDNVLQQYPYSVKYSDTSEGVRITVHVYGYDGNGTVDELNRLYEYIRGTKPEFAPMVKVVKEKVDKK